MPAGRAGDAGIQLLEALHRPTAQYLKTHGAGDDAHLKEQQSINAIKGIYSNGQVLPVEPTDWPERCPVLTEPLPGAGKKVGLDESEWRDDPASRADWKAPVKTIEPLDFTPEEEAALSRFQDVMRQHNLEAVRQQIAGGPPA